MVATAPATVGRHPLSPATKGVGIAVPWPVTIPTVASPTEVKSVAPRPLVSF